MIGIEAVAKIVGVSPSSIRTWMQKGLFPQATICNCHRHILWEENQIRRWKVAKLASALRKTHPNQWTINSGFHLPT